MSGDADVRDIAQISGVMTAIQLAITEVKDASELAARIASGEISSADVTTAYCARAAIAHQLVREIKARADCRLAACQRSSLIDRLKEQRS